MLFYTVFAIAIALGAPRIRFCLLVFLSLFLAGQAWRGAVPLVFYAQSIIFEFVLGVGVAQVLTRFGTPHRSIATLLMLAGFVFMFAFGWRTDGERLVPWGIGAAVVVMGAVWLEDWIKRMPGVRQLSFLGDASYSIYLSHPFVVPAAVVLLKRIGLEDTMVIALLACAAVIVAGALSHVVLEKPMISFFKRLLFPAAPSVIPTTPHAGNSPVK
jgi:peptidoglycan/LPS O-acetylase OafA/YrhL